MAADFTLQGLWSMSTLVAFPMVTLLLLVLGFDNLLYVVIESRRVAVERRRRVRRWGIVLSLFLWGSVFGGMLLMSALGGAASIGAWAVGGVITMWLAAHEVFHFLGVDHLEVADVAGSRRTGAALREVAATSAVFGIAASTVAMVLAPFAVLALAALVITAVAMVWLSDHATRFLEAYRGYQVVGLLGVLIVGSGAVMRAGEAGELSIAAVPVTAPSSAAILIVIGTLCAVAAMQRRYRRLLISQRAEAARIGVPTTEPDFAARRGPRSD